MVSFLSSEPETITKIVIDGLFFRRMMVDGLYFDAGVSGMVVVGLYARLSSYWHRDEHVCRF